METMDLQLVSPEFDQIQRDLEARGARPGNPLILERDPPKHEQVEVLLRRDLGSIRVTLTDKPNLPPPLGNETHDPPEQHVFDAVTDSSKFLGWSERDSSTASYTSAELVTVILKLAGKD